MIPKGKDAPLFLMVANKQTRHYLANLLKENDYSPAIVPDKGELLQALKKQRFAIAFIDCEAVTSYGAGVYAKIKVACPGCRILLLGDRAHLRNKLNRDLVKEAMDVGVYACILAPYEEWEVLSMVRHILTKEYASIIKEPKETRNQDGGGKGA